MNQTIETFPACPTQLSEEQVAQFQREGFLAFTDVLSATEVEAAKNGFVELLARVAHSDRGSNGRKVWGLEGTRLQVQFEKGFEPDDQDLPELELKLRKFMWFVDEHPHFHYLAHEHTKVNGVLESLLGSDPILFQDMALVKPPFIGTEKPWHQDNAYFAVAPLESICGVWIALDEATVENGCMHVLRGGHHRALKHYHERDCEILPDRLQDQDNIVPVRLPPGGALFFAGMLPHFTPQNNSPLRRRAIQYHYRSQDSRLVKPDEYDKLYAEPDGTPASCRAAAR